MYALISLLSKIPRDYSGAIAIVQHLPVGFTDAFAAFLRSRIALELCVVQSSMPIQRSKAYLAPDDRHLVIQDGDRVGPQDSPPIGPHRPAGDVLLSSMAAHHGSRAVGIILSGIGQDGVRGLMDMRARGALTLAQDRESSAVYGMPKAATESGAAARALDPEGMAKLLIAFDLRFSPAAGARQ